MTSKAGDGEKRMNWLVVFVIAHSVSDVRPFLSEQEAVEFAEGWAGSGRSLGQDITACVWDVRHNRQVLEVGLGHQWWTDWEAKR